MEQIYNIAQINTETERLFSGASVEWSRSKKLIWENTFEAIVEQPAAKTIYLRQRIVRLSVAASLIILVSFGSIAWFHSQTFVSRAGTHLSVALPDGSSVDLNAGSLLKFYPYRWPVSRNVELNGEGFFNVEKGGKFVVKSKFGETSVLGTSFNIFARDDSYRVLCVTGRVQVKAENNDLAILVPNEQVIIKAGKLVEKVANVIPENITSWRSHQFVYTAAPFAAVIEEIERQYGISIHISEELVGGTISCNIPKKPDVEGVLSVVCKPLGYKFKKKSEKSYLISRNN